FMGPEFVDNDDIGMLQGAGGLGLTLEALQKIWVLGKAAGHHLDGDWAPDAWVYSLVNNTHAAFTEFVGDIVLTYFLNYVRRHEWATLEAQAPGPCPIACDVININSNCLQPGIHSPSPTRGLTGDALGNLRSAT